MKVLRRLMGYSAPHHRRRRTAHWHSSGRRWRMIWVHSWLWSRRTGTWGPSSHRMRSTRHWTTAHHVSSPAHLCTSHTSANWRSHRWASPRHILHHRTPPWKSWAWRASPHIERRRRPPSWWPSTYSWWPPSMEMLLLLLMSPTSPDKSSVGGSSRRVRLPSSRESWIVRTLRTRPIHTRAILVSWKPSLHHVGNLTAS